MESARSESKSSGSFSWLKVAAGPLAFLLVELLFRPVLELSPELRSAHPEASVLLVRHALAATCWIAVWWFTEALPIPVTSLLPLLLFPVLGLGTASEVSRQYGHDIIFLFIGGLLLAAAMEKTGLHERFAFRIIRLFGRGPRALVLGFMVATATLSMWISNTATTVMILPVALAVLSSYEADDGHSVDQVFPVALLLGVAFGANIGGLGTPIGSPTNIIMQSVYRAKTGEEVSFGQWMLYGVPLMMLLLPLAWWLLARRLPKRAAEGQLKLPTPGAMDAVQLRVLVVFLATALLWITRGDFGVVHGWGSRLAEYGVILRDSSVAVAAAILLFILPGRDRRPILSWKVSRDLPWGIVLLLGAGFAISKAFDQSGLTLWIGSQIEGFGRLPWNDSLLFLTLLATVVAVSILVTEFASNTASASILVPIVYGVAIVLGPERFSPELLMVACALGCTTGFAVPAGTPPNAIVFSTERISIRRFARKGIVMDGLSVIAIVVMIWAWHLVP